MNGQASSLVSSHLGVPERLDAAPPVCGPAAEVGQRAPAMRPFETLGRRGEIARLRRLAAAMLVEAKPTPSGVVMALYRPDGAAA